MSTILLRLAAPLQSWGSESKFETRRTERFPTKSGVIGILASALGRSREEAVDDLNAMKFGVRVDREGEVITDYHIAIAKYKEDTYITYRNYLSDAIFLVGFESEDRDFLQKIEYALKNPAYPLFLGRRSCPPTMPLLIGIREGKLIDTLKSEPWLLEDWRQAKIHDDSEYMLRIVADSDGENRNSVMRDVPLSYSRIQRKYGWRYVKDYGYIDIKKSRCTYHDPMTELEDLL